MFFYAFMKDGMIRWVVYTGLATLLVVGTVFWHRKMKIARMRQRGIRWRSNINNLIRMTTQLTREEQKELYAVMLEKGLEVRQQKDNGEMIRQAIENEDNADWWVFYRNNM